ncbi:MAG: glycine oxidase ThiO [Isosphaeraceae bacterium]
MRPQPSDLVVVGGGVVGLSVAYAVAQEGLSVTVLDRAEIGKAASWAGAGILSPGGERTPNNPVAALRSLSAELFAEWSTELRAETGVDNGYRRCGGVDVATSPAEEQALLASAGRWREEGIAFERLPPSEFARVEPALSPDLAVAYFLPDRAQVRNPWHLRALTRALEKRQVILRPGLGALGFVAKGDRIAAVRTDDGPIECEWAVMAAGPWSGGLLEPLEVKAPTPPVRGQIVLLKTAPPALRRIVEHGARYLVPRDDGHVLVGSTEENAGFDARPTAVAVRELIGEAFRLCPSLASAEFVRAWAGLRPGSIDTRPYLGPTAPYPNLVLATGHRRAGLQLSTGTAEVVRRIVLGLPEVLDLAAFRPGREPAASGESAFRS